MTHHKVTIPEPWPTGTCGICGRRREIRGAFVRADNTHGNACEECMEQIAPRPRP